jgi:DNA-binding transcriptional LysR family regulator
VPFDIPDLVRPIGAIYRRNKPLTPAVSRFLSLLREETPSSPAPARPRP